MKPTLTDTASNIAKHSHSMYTKAWKWEHSLRSMTLAIHTYIVSVPQDMCRLVCLCTVNTCAQLTHDTNQTCSWLLSMYSTQNKPLGYSHQVGYVHILQVSYLNNFPPYHLLGQRIPNADPTKLQIIIVSVFVDYV